jgi:hypothetical protein
MNVPRLPDVLSLSPTYLNQPTVAMTAQPHASLQPTPARSAEQARQLILPILDHVELSAEQLSGLRQVLLHYLTEQLDEEVDRVLKSTGQTAAELIQKTRFTNRTERLAQIVH